VLLRNGFESKRSVRITIAARSPVASNRSTDISGDYAAMARAFGAYGERITAPEEIVPAIKRGIEQTRAGKPALLEFITAQETKASRY